MRIPTGLAALAAMLAVGCTAPEGETAAPPSPPPAASVPVSGAIDMAAVAAGNRRFALSLYGALAEREDGNIFFSPIGIGTVFGPVIAGARGETRDEIASVMEYPVAGDGLHPVLGGLGRVLVRDGDDATLSIANALWPLTGFAIEPGFVETAQRDYDEGVDQLDYSGDPGGSAARINHWASDRTHGRIDRLVSADQFDDTTRLVITNAVYFLGDWAAPFFPAGTRDTPFAPGGEVVPMMQRTGSYRWIDAGSYEALDMPYRDADLVMTVLLPKRADGLAALERGLDADALTALLERLDGADETRIDLMLPKLELRTGYQLGDILAVLGMPRAFSNAADFSGITRAEQLAIDSVIHKTYLRVDEQGTEAAAATAVEIVAVSAPRPAPPPHAFHADHPYLFLIRDRASGALLFMGRIVRPES